MVGAIITPGSNVPNFRFTLLLMTQLRQLSALALIGLTGLIGCQKDDAGPASTGLTGTWKLTKRDCYCFITPVPDETITFTATTFSVHENGLLTATGSYTTTTAPVECGSSTRVPVVHLAATQGYSHYVVSTVVDNKLVLDYKADGGGCISDTPVDTYERLPFPL